MAQALETRAATTAEIYFELDRFEPTEDGLCVELSGRWFGVRGRRFVRPTLTMLVGGVRRRLLADLEHKPWAAEDGSSWIASFPWELAGEPVSELELGVAPDLEIGLPVPGSAPQRAEVRRGRQVAPRRHDGADESARALDAARGENDRLRDELERAADAKVEAAAAIARRDTALSKLDELTEARGATLAERDAAVLARDAATAERDRAFLERDRAIHSRDQALDRCERMVRRSAELQSQLDEARATIHHAELERRRTRLAHEHAQAGAVARSALAANPPARRRHLGWSRSAAGSAEAQASWTGRLIALAVLIGAVLAMALVAHLV